VTGDEVLSSSPLLFGYRGEHGRLAVCDARSGARFRLTDDRAACLLSAFLQPRRAREALAEGFTLNELEQACQAGVLVRQDELATSGLWERNGWSRPAFLMFSQMDIPYDDAPERIGDDGQADLIVRRRETVSGYLADSIVPPRRLLAQGPKLELPPPEPEELRLAHLTERRSVRAFSEVPPSLEQLATVLHESTHALRSVIEDRSAEDPFLLLNSFYSWAHPFVVIQEVEGIDPGAYEYDPVRHELVCTGSAPEPAAILASVQGQRGVLGPGFVLFLVADLRGYAWLYRHSRAYLHVLIQVGELGQELLTAATAVGLAGWVTPAVHESRAAEILCLPSDDGVEPLSIVKLGRPRRSATNRC